MAKQKQLGKITLVPKVAKPKPTKTNIPETNVEDWKNQAIVDICSIKEKKPYNLTVDVSEGINSGYKLDFISEMDLKRKVMVTAPNADYGGYNKEDYVVANAIMAVQEFNIMKAAEKIFKSKTTNKYASKGIIKAVDKNWTSGLLDTNIREFLKNQKEIPGLFAPLNTLVIKKLLDSIKTVQGYKFGYSKNLLMVLKLIAFIRVSQNKRFRKYKMDLKDTDGIVAVAILKDCSSYGLSDDTIFNELDLPKDVYVNWYKYQIKRASQFDIVQEVSNYDPIIKWALLEESCNVSFDKILGKSILQIPDNTFLKTDSLHINILKLLNVIKKNANCILYNQNNLIWDMDHTEMKKIRNYLSRSGNKFFIKKVEKVIKILYTHKELKDEFLIKVGIFLKKDELYSILKNKVKKL